MTGRRIVTELLKSAPDELARGNLRDITRVNRWFGGLSTATSLLRSLAPPERFSLLDVGAASGDHARAFQRAFPGCFTVSVDLSERNLAAAPPHRLVADAFRPPFCEASFDYVFCSLFLHHFGDEEVTRLLACFGRLARRAVVVTDLERHNFPYWFLPATQWLFRWNPITLNDGPVSVAAGFRIQELERLAWHAGLRQPVVRRHRPWFRISLVAARYD
jgi:hypothetical protein